MHLIHAIADCRNCDWHCETRNAMGLAAKHHKATGHIVNVETGWSHTYGDITNKKDQLQSNKSKSRDKRKMLRF
jgi:hypothetical protein